MLVECGLVRITAGDGAEATFRPALGRIAALASPEGLVELYGALHGAHAETAAADVLAGLCDPENLEALPALIGAPHWEAQESEAQTSFTLGSVPRLQFVGGVVPPSERVIIARHLLEHGMVGRARPGGDGRSAQGSYSQSFNAAEYIAAARVHLGLSSADAEAMSMTELQRMFELKFPDATRQDVPTREQYEAGMKAYDELQARQRTGVAMAAAEVVHGA